MGIVSFSSESFDYDIHADGSLNVVFRDGDDYGEYATGCCDFGRAGGCNSLLRAGCGA
jgi:hypothetical protein